MRIAVMGAGGLGGNYGARLAAGGQDVAFIARGANLRGLRDRGLLVTSEALGDIRLDKVRVSDDPAEIGPVDVVLLTTKRYDLEAAAEATKPLLGPETAVISLLNGIDSEARMVAILGPRHVVGGAAYTTAHLLEPGRIRHVSGPQRIAVGELDGRISPRLEGFAEVAEAAGIETLVSDEIQALIWAKFVLLAGIGGVCALARQPVGAIREDAELRALSHLSMAEIVAVAEAEGIEIPGAEAAGAAFIENSAADLEPSLLVDLNRGRRLEGEWFSGEILRLGRLHGVATPIHQAIWAALRPFAAGLGTPGS